MADLFERLRKALVGTYRVERELGEGGMAHVYLADDLKYPRQVAIKVLKPKIAEDIGLKRFVHEIEIAAGLAHPYILPFLSSGSADGLLYYVMPYAEGESLRERLDREKQLPVEATLEITRDVAEALDYAHGRGVVHRDIKPDNIMLSKGHALVADFGIAHAIQEAGTRTQTETVIGTPGYMSPEQSVGRKVDHRSDIYSLGCVVHEMLTGETPPSDFGERPAATNLRSRLAPVLVKALRRSLSGSPSERFETAGAFYEALAAQTRRRPRAWVAAAAITMLAILVVNPGTREPIMDWFRGERPPRPMAMTLVADFDGPTDDPELAGAVRELISADMDQSSMVQSLHRDQIRFALELAEMPETTRVSTGVARDLAVRNGIKTVVEGRIDRLGSGYSIVLTLIDAASGNPIRTLRQSANNEDRLIPTADELAGELRKVLGEKASVVQASGPLWRVLTPSFAAHRKGYKGYSLQHENRHREAIPFYWEALALDPGFAAAYVNLGICYQTLLEADSAKYALNEALKRKERLSEYYALIAMATLETDLDASLRLHDRWIEDFPDDWIGHNNRGFLLRDFGLWNKARLEFATAVKLCPIRPYPVLLWNLMETLVIMRDLDSASAVADQIEGTDRLHARLQIALAGDDAPGVENLVNAVGDDPLADAGLRARAALSQAGVDARSGAVRSATTALIVAESAAKEAFYPLWFHLALRLRLVLSAELQRELGEVKPFPDEDGSSLITEGMIHASSGDMAAAQGARVRLLAQPQEELERLGTAPDLLEAWMAHCSGRWESVIESLGPQARRGTELGFLTDRTGRVLARWLVAHAFERLAQPDSAIAHLEMALAVDDMYWEERVQRAVLESYVRRRLALLYSELGQQENARRHWMVLTAVVTRPDPDVQALLAETRSALDGARSSLLPLDTNERLAFEARKRSRSASAERE